MKDAAMYLICDFELKTWKDYDSKNCIIDRKLGLYIK